MALSTYSVDTAIAALQKDGFFCIQDPAIAVAITTTDAKKAQFLSSSPLALEFYRLNVFLNQVRARIWFPMTYADINSAFDPSSRRYLTGVLSEIIEESMRTLVIYFSSEKAEPRQMFLLFSCGTKNPRLRTTLVPTKSRPKSWKVSGQQIVCSKLLVLDWTVQDARPGRYHFPTVACESLALCRKTFPNLLLESSWIRAFHLA